MIWSAAAVSSRGSDRGTADPVKPTRSSHCSTPSHREIMRGVRLCVRKCPALMTGYNLLNLSPRDQLPAFASMRAMRSRCILKGCQLAWSMVRQDLVCPAILPANSAQKDHDISCKVIACWPKVAAVLHAARGACCKGPAACRLERVPQQMCYCAIIYGLDVGTPSYARAADCGQSGLVGLEHLSYSPLQICRRTFCLMADLDLPPCALTAGQQPKDISYMSSLACIVDAARL